MRPLDLDRRTVRRLAITRQRLAGPRPAADADGLREVLRALRCLQLDPVAVVARSHLLVLWSRVGRFDRADLDALLWDERWLFEYWAHAASIVLTEDYALHRGLMRRYPRGVSAYGRRLVAWVEANAELREHVLQRLEDKGPLPVGGFEDRSALPWESGGWTKGRNVERMLDLLWTQGRVMVAGREGGKRLWDLAERCLPERTDRTELPDADIVSLSAEHALRALGAGRARDVANHFVRDRYDALPEALERLVADGRAVRARVEGADPGEPWFVHADVLPLLETVGGEAWGPRTVLLSPFDNLLCDRERTELLWGFRFRTEMYVPKARREFGYYVLPVLHGDRLVGRIAPRFDRRRGVLDLENVYAEPGAAGVRAAGPDAGAGPSPDPASAEEVADAAEGVAGAVADLAGFLGAREVVCSGAVPAPWREALRRVEAAPVP
ncbi:crosslink repair DNA glycosylase YcaQ family protein [Nocardiopsis sp. NPDC006198]|uniref:winged helix-turn-helix domain-containing protein n=1 Tax=Nocardiopsis sp. NPDC006198 TaxID=3154472 RepID=UPI0033A238A6